MQMCRRDGDVKMALQAWSAYGPPGVNPPDLFTPVNPLRQAFGLMGSATIASTTAAKVSPSQAAVRQTAPMGAAASETSETTAQNPWLPAAVEQLAQKTAPGNAGQSPDADCSSGQAEALARPEQLAAPVSSAHDGHLGSGPQQSRNTLARTKPLAEAVPSVGMNQAAAAPQQSQNAFSMLMSAAKQPRPMQRMQSTAGAGAQAASRAVAGKGPAPGFKAAWQNALQQVALDPEGYACFCLLSHS